MRKNKGITLIALVVTIVVTIIIAGISINLLLGENGILTKAKEAKKAQKVAEVKEKLSLEIAAAETDAIIRDENLEQRQLEDIINKYGTLQEDGDTILTKEDNYELSLKEIWYGVLSTSGSYSDKVEQVEMLEKEVEDLKKKCEQLENLNQENSGLLEDLRGQIENLQKEKENLENELQEERNKSKDLEDRLQLAENQKQDIQGQLDDLNNTLGQTDATADKILKNYKAYSKGSLITGTMENRGVLNWSPSASETKTIAAGYYSGGTISTANAYNAGVNSGKSNAIIKLGNGTSFNVSNYDGYKNFTINNFIVDFSSLSCNAEGHMHWTGNSEGSKDITITTSSSLSKSYNASTGVLTISLPNSSQQGGGTSGVSDKNRRWVKTSITFSASPTVYLIR